MISAPPNGRGLFFVYGLGLATWFSRIPEVAGSLRLSEGILGLVLMGVGLGSLAAMPLGDRLVTRRGSRKMAVGGAYGFGVSLCILAIPRTPLPLFMALVVYGSASGVLVVAMNVQAISLEAQLGRRVLPSLYGLLSLGSVTGAALGSITVSAGMGRESHFLSVGFLIAVAAASARGSLVADVEADAPSALADRSRPLGLLTLAAMAFLLVFGELSVADWGALFLVSELRASPALAAGAYGSFSASATLTRLVGSRILELLGMRLTTCGGALLAAIGLALAAASAAWWTAIAGFALTGLGLACVAPVLAAAGGRFARASPSKGVAVVAGATHAGYLAAPPLIGAVGSMASVRSAFQAIAVLMLSLALLAGLSRELLADDAFRLRA